MSFKENLLKKIKIDILSQKVINTIGAPGSEKKVKKEFVRELMEMSAYEPGKERDIELYILETGTDKKKILAVDNEMAVYNTSVEDVALRKSPTVKEMLNFKNIVKILNDTDVVISKKTDSVRNIQKECIDLLDLSFTRSDLDEIEKDGTASLERQYSDGVVETLVLFAELLNFVPAPKEFKVSSHKVFGGLSEDEDGKKRFGPIVMYSLIHNKLMLINEKISSFEKGKIETIHKIAAEKAEPSMEGAEVFTFLKNAVDMP